MGFTLAEKQDWGSHHLGREPCDLDMSESSASARGSAFDDAAALELPLGALLTATVAATAAALLLWAFFSAFKCSLRLLPAISFGRYGSSYMAGEDDDGDNTSAALHGSPPTPPPTGWLRDTDSRALYMTPPAEPLLFSVSPALESTARQAWGPYDMPYSAMPSTVGPYSSIAFASGPLTGGSTGGGAGPSSGGSIRCRRGGGGGGQAGGWDRNLLTQQAALLPAISSLDGLVAAPEFQEHMRSSHRRSPFLAREQSQAKVQLYKDLRRMDPDAFRRLMTRDDIMSYEACSPPLALAVADYLLGVLVVPLAIAALANSQASGSVVLRYGPTLVWLAAKWWLATAGHTSLLGRMTGMYLVYDTLGDEQQGHGWESMAGLGGHALLALFELSMAMMSLGLLAVGALVSIAVSQQRQTLAMRFLGLRLERELCRPTRLSPFSPTSDAAASVPSKAPSHPSRESMPGRYGPFKQYR